MDIYALIIIGIIFGYLCGSIPFALIFGKLIYKTDVRKHGSGNLGATNVTRTLGPVAGIIVLLFDMLKGGLPALGMYYISEAILQNSYPEQLKYISIIYCVTGFFAGFGHCHPIFAKFQGGKAVATICGFLLFMNIRLWLVAIISFIIIVLITKIVSLGSIGAAIFTMLASLIPFFNKCYIFKYNELDPRIIGTELPLFIYQLTIIMMGLLLIYRHISNIRKLIKGEEKKFSIDKVTKK